MQPMNIIIPMGGKGARFSTSGFTLPKPLIDVAGKPMYRHAVDSMPLALATKLIFIFRKNSFHDQLSADIKLHYSAYNCHIKLLEHDTQGQAETVLEGASLLNAAQPTLIHNCDTYIASCIAWKDMLYQNIDGAMVLFKSVEDRWSYAKLNENNSRIIDVREKQVISSYASTGTYFFKDTQLLLKDIQAVITHGWQENNEYYLSTIYRLMLQRRQYILPLWAESLLCFGTPQDLVASLNDMLSEERKSLRFHDPKP